MQAIIMTRISTREQEMGHSIEAQLQRLQDYAARHKLDIIQTYSIVESSTKGSRKKFREVVAQIQRSKCTIALVTDTVDRLLRNFKDSIVLDELRKEDKVHLHFIRENLILTKDSNSADLIRWDIAIMFSKSYVLMMRDNILRSMKHKVQHRGIINHLPTGYLHQDKKGILDPVRAPLIKQLFELYATGNYSIEMLHREITLRGLTSKSTSRPLTRASIHNILNNTTYYGTCKAFGKIYTPDIEPIVTHDLWQRCQDILRDRDLNPCKIQGKSFLFKRLITCSECGSHISFIEKKSRYVYGFCNTCRIEKRPYHYVREEKIISEIKRELIRIRMPDEIYEAAVSKLAEIPGDNLGGYSLDELGTQIDALKPQISRLMDLYLQGGIDSSEYSQKLAMLRSDEEKLIKLKDKKAADLNPFRQLSKMLTIVQNASVIFMDGNTEIRSKLLELMFHKIVLNGKRLAFTVSYGIDMSGKFLEKKNGRLGLPDLELIFQDKKWAETVAKCEVISQLIQGDSKFFQCLKDVS